MRALIQRVSEAAVVVNGEKVGQIGQGYLVLLGIQHDDAEAHAAYLARKIAAHVQVSGGSDSSTAGGQIARGVIKGLMGN